MAAPARKFAPPRPGEKRKKNLGTHTLYVVVRYVTLEFGSLRAAAHAAERVVASGTHL